MTADVFVCENCGAGVPRLFKRQCRACYQYEKRNKRRRPEDLCDHVPRSGVVPTVLASA